MKFEPQRMSECEDIVIIKSWHVYMYIWFWLILVPLKKYAATSLLGYGYVTLKFHMNVDMKVNTGDRNRHMVPGPPEPV